MVVGVPALSAQDQTPQPTVATAGPGDQAFFYPRSLQTGEWDGMFDMVFARVPYDVVEENQTYRWPLFGLRGRVGLPSDFMILGSVETAVIIFNLTVGPRWNYEFTDRFTANIGADVSWFGGRLNAAQFDQSANGWMAAPNITLGYRFDDVTVSGKFNTNHVLSVSSRTGDIETQQVEGFYNGWTISVWVEQPLWRDNYVLIGIRANHMKFYYPTWLLAPTFDKFYYIPEFTLGLKL
jgi:hypothetical protein